MAKLENISEIILAEYPDIEIIYATIMGSRCYGYNRTDSDFDIVFIYKQKDNSNYTSDLKSQNLVKNIRFEKEEYEFQGWDISRALLAHYQHNIDLFEIFNTSTYYVNKNYIDGLNELPIISRPQLRSSYRRYARRIYEKYVKDKPEDMKSLKKLLLVIHRLLCFLVLNNGYYPSLEMGELFKQSEISNVYINNFNLLIENYRSNKFNVSFDLWESCTRWVEYYLYDFDESNPLINVHHDYSSYNRIYNEITNTLEV